MLPPLITGRKSHCDSKLITYHELSVLVSGGIPSGWKVVASSRYARVCKREVGISVFFKLFLPRTPLEGIKAIFRGSRSRRFVQGTEALLKAGFLAPRVLCWDESFVMAMMGRGWVLTEAIDGRGVLDSWRKLFPANDVKDIRRFVDEVAIQVSALHNAAIAHGDLRLNNMLVAFEDKNIKLFFIDNERSRKHSRLPFKERVKNLVQMNRDALNEIPIRYRAYFFARYCRYCSLSIGERRRLIEAVEARTRHVLGRAC